jgi:DNA adenine methylase
MMTVNGASGTDSSGFSFSDSYVRGGREARVNRWYQLPERRASR